jgi:hypothetical protein
MSAIIVTARIVVAPISTSRGAIPGLRDGGGETTTLARISHIKSEKAAASCY